MSYAQQIADFTNAEMAKGPYQENFIAVHCAALANTFAATAELLESDFAAVAQTYVKHYPSNYWDINFYGEHFSAFIAAQANGPKNKPWRELAWLAELEYTITVCYYGSASQQYPLPRHIESVEKYWQAVLVKHHPYLRLSAPLSMVTHLKQHHNTVVADVK